MSDSETWEYDEHRHIGTDYSSKEQVEAYDEYMRGFRDVAGEARHILELLDLKPESTVLELGTGTGEFAIAAAGQCSKVYAADISPAMIAYAREKARSRGVKNIEFHVGGFLSYQHSAPPVDAVVSQLALHHLPDLWKAVAIRRLSDVLKPDGLFYLKDVVFPADTADYGALFADWISRTMGLARKHLKDQVKVHIGEEYSTLDWIIEGMLARSGFVIVSSVRDGPMAEYLCRRVES